MAAPDPDLTGEHILARFDAVASRMPDVARATEAFADEKLRERAYYELVSILNPDTEDGDTLSGDVVRRLADATREESQDGEEFGEVMLRLLDELRDYRKREPGDLADVAEDVDEEAREGESFTETIARLLGELGTTRDCLSKAHWALIRTGLFTADQVGDNIAARITELVEEVERHRQREADRIAQERWVAPAAPEIPQWVPPILDAYLDGKILDFSDAEVPQPVLDRVMDRIRRSYPEN